MLAFGYQWDSEEERPEKLREASLVCTREELDDLIEMLTTYRDEADAEAGDHQHFQDWSGGWDRSQSDFIIFLSDKRWTKEIQE